MSWPRAWALSVEDISYASGEAREDWRSVFFDTQEDWREAYLDLPSRSGAAIQSLGSEQLATIA